MSYNPTIGANKAGDTFTGPLTTTGKKANYSTKSANYTVAPTDEHIEAITAGITITLPDAVANNKSIFNIKNSSTGSVTVAAATSQKIDGADTYVLTIQYQAITIISNGSNWSIY